MADRARTRRCPARTARRGHLGRGSSGRGDAGSCTDRQRPPEGGTDVCASPARGDAFLGTRPRVSVTFVVVGAAGGIGGRVLARLDRGEVLAIDRIVVPGGGWSIR